MDEQDPTPDAGVQPPWVDTFEGAGPVAPAAPAGVPVHSIVTGYGQHVGLFVGVCLVAAGSWPVAVAGVLLATCALLAADRPARDPATLARASAGAAALVLGLGLLVGGAQDLGDPAARVLLPVGLVLSCVAFAHRRGFPLRGATGSTVIAGVVVAAFALHHGAAALAPAPRPAQVAEKVATPAKDAAAAKDTHAAAAPDRGGQDAEPAAHATAKDEHAPSNDEHAAATDEHVAKDEHATTADDEHVAEDGHAAAADDDDEHEAPAAEASSDAGAGARGFTFLSEDDEEEIAALERAARRAALGAR